MNKAEERKKGWLKTKEKTIANPKNHPLHSTVRWHIRYLTLNKQLKPQMQRKFTITKGKLEKVQGYMAILYI